MEEDHQELQLLPSPHSNNLPSSSSSSKPSTWATSDSTRKLQSMKNLNPFEGPSLDLQLSISFRTIKNRPKPKDHFLNNKSNNKNDGNMMTMMTTMDGSVEALKWQAAEQIRLAALEKAYAERVRELSRREMEMAQTEFARARSMWERAGEEVEKAEKLKERATRITMEDASKCMEITCNSCRQKFRP